MEPVKVHGDLNEVARDTVYHMGHYAVDLEDGELRFQLLAQICQEPTCGCDQLQIDWHTPETAYSTWLSSDGSWRDGKHQPLHEDLLQIFGNIADTDLFKDRYAHLLFLRRKMVLEEAGRLEGDFQYRVPMSLLLPGADAGRETMGSLKLSSKQGKVGFRLEVCGDESCYCENLFLSFESELGGAVIGPDGTWSPAEDDPGMARVAARAKAKLAHDPRFEKLLAAFRHERVLHNYHRHVRAVMAQGAHVNG